MLLDIPKQIIEKYDGMANEDYLLPVPQYITVCKNIKKIIGLAVLKRRLRGIPAAILWQRKSV